MKMRWLKGGHAVKGKFVTWLAIFVLLAGMIPLYQAAPVQAAEEDGETLSLIASETTYVTKGNPDRNNGNRNTINVWQDNDVALVKFDLSEVGDPGQIVSAVLRAYNDEISSPADVSVYGVDPDSWSQHEVTWNTRPQEKTEEWDRITVPAASEQYNEFDVTDYVTGYNGDVISFQLEAAQPNRVIRFHSLSNDNPPMLVITLDTESQEPDPGDSLVVGWSGLQPSEDSRVIYVSSSEGDDGNDGLTPATPVASIAKAAAMVRDGYPDWIVLKRGDVWVDEDVHRFINGRSAEEPAVIAYYGDSGPRPLIKASAYFVNTDGAVRNYQAFVGLHIVNYKMDPDDPAFTGQNHSGVMRFVGGGDFLLIEDCKLEYGEIVVQGYEGNHHTNVTVHRNIVTDNYWFGSTHDNSKRPSGIYAADIVGLTITENVFDHNGWNAQFEDTQANMYNHNMYLQYSNDGNTMVVRGNIVTRASSHGIQGRPGGLFEDNLIVRNSIGLLIGYSQVPLKEGVHAVARNNVILNGKRMMPDKSTEPQTAAVWGLDVDNLGEGAITLENNIVANRLESGANSGITNLAGVTYIDNIQYNWGGGIGDMEGGPNNWAWKDPTRSVESYHATLGKPATLESFLDVVRNRGLGEWDEDYTAYAVNEYIREGFVEEEGKEIEDEFRGKTTRAVKAAVNIDDETDAGWSRAIPVTDFVQSGQLVFGPEAVIEPELRTLWDEDNLYVRVEVKDALIAGTTDESLLAKPAIELYIDQTHQKANTKTEGYLIIHIAFDGSIVRYTDGETDLLGTEHGIEAVSRVTEDGYVIAAKIPWTVDTLTDRSYIGFDLSVNEYNPNGNRRTWLHWNDITSSVYLSAAETGNLLLRAAESGKRTTAVYGTPVIDGTVDPIWDQAVTETEFLQSGSLVFGPQASIVPSFKTMWDENYFYVLVETEDEFAAGNSSDEELLAQPAVELYMDLTNDRLERIQDGFVRIYIAYDGSVTTYRNGLEDLADTEHGIEAAGTITEDGYALEAKIPWFGGTPQESALGFDVSMNEYKYNGSGVPERKTWVHWKDITSTSYKDVSKLGNLDLGTDEGEYPFTISDLVVDTTHGVTASAAVAPTGAGGTATVIFKLLQGDTTIDIVAMETTIEQPALFKALFPAATGTEYTVKVFVRDHLDPSGETDGIDLAIPQQS